MYPAVMTLGGDWKFRIADRIEVRDVTAEMQAFLDRVVLADLKKPETWDYMRGIAEHRGDCLIPEHIGIDDNITAIATKYVPQLADDEPNLVSTIRDLVASKLRTGKPPQIVRALKPFPIGEQTTLQPVNFAGRIPFDPARDNWYQFLVNQRQAIKRDGDPFDEEAAYKETVNADYGISAEMNISEQDGTVYGLGEQTWESPKVEMPGEYANLLLAPDITAGARLMLAMFQVQINEAGTHHILMDTDSIAPMATPDGSEGISWDRVQQIAESFDSLNPWDIKLIPHLIDWQYPAKNADGSREPIRFSSIAAKRYALWRMNGDQIELVKRSEHGLGGYISPYLHDAQLADDSDDVAKLRKRFIDEIWAYGIAKYVLNLNPDEPWWFNLPAVQQFKIRTRFAYRQFDYPDKPYLEKVIPQNFFITVTRPRFATQESQDWNPANVRLIAPFDPDQSRWLSMEWTDVETGQPYRITTDDEDKTPGRFLVKTYGDLVEEYFNHPEVKYVDSKGNPCRPNTRGILYPGIAIPEYHSHISKDASAVRTAQDHFSYRGGHVFHADDNTRLIELTRFILSAKKLSVRDIEHATDVDKMAVHRFLTTATTLRKVSLEGITSFAARLASEDMRAIRRRPRTTSSELELLREWKTLVDNGELAVTKYQRPTLTLKDVLLDDFKLIAEDVPPGEIL
jgi:hypothetical protein